MRQLQLLLCLVSLYHVSANHFRGSIITWRYIPDNPEPIEVNFWVAWKKDFDEPQYDPCTPASVASGTLLKTGRSLQCGNQVWRNMTYVCTDYNTGGDYAAGMGTHKFSAPSDTNIFQISFSSCCWVNLVNFGPPRSYEINATVDLTPRAERNGLINSSPTAAIVPVQLVAGGCPHVIRIPMSDPDGDVVRCRFPQVYKRECYRVCGALQNTTVRNVAGTCILTIGGLDNIGWYAGTIMIEDFKNRRSNKAFSRVPLHFLINVTAADTCHSPRFVSPTPEDGDCLPASVGQPMTVRLAARSDDVSYSFSGISTFGLPRGMRASSLASDSVDPLTFYIDLQWTPVAEQTGRHAICFAAFDRKNDKEFASEQVCITVYVGALIAHPVPEQSTPQDDGIVDFTNERWVIHFNTSVEQHDTGAGAMVSFILDSSGQIMHSVNLATGANDNVDFAEDDNVVFTTPGFTLDPDTKYTLRLHEGAVRTDSKCKCASAAAEWTFSTTPDNYLPATRFTPEEFRHVPTAVPECFSSFMLIYVSKSWLATVSSLVEPANMHLNDPSCTGEDFNETHYVLGAPHDLCGTVVETESSDIQTVQNVVHIPPQPESSTSIITRDNNVEVHVTCRLDGARVTHAQFDPNITTIIYYETGYGSFNFMLRMYQDDGFSSKYRPNNYPIDVGQKERLYFEAKVVSDEEMTVFLSSCRATPTANPRDLTNYVFIDMGCKVDDTVQFHEHTNPARKRFSIEAFAFTGHDLHGTVFIHCDLATCFAEDPESLCTRGCIDATSVARRDVSDQSGASSKAYPNTDGPIRIHTDEKKASLISHPVMADSTQFNMSLVELPMLTTTVLLLSVILVVLVRAYRLLKSPKQMRTSASPHRVDRVILPSIPIGKE